MTKIVLFDWGDTLMIDFPNQKGKMCHWDRVEAVEGATETLATLAKSHSIYVATNAADSTEDDIKAAFQRVGLAQYITGYFCKFNLGIGKGNPEFFHAIVRELKCEPHSVVMVGDSLENDVLPAISAGIDAVWFNPLSPISPSQGNVRQISRLCDLFTVIHSEPLS